MVQERVPSGTLLIFRTGAAGAWGQCAAEPVDYMHIQKSHIFQLNAAARAVVRRRPRWRVLDVEQMVAQYECPNKYLRDIIHLNTNVTWTVLNLYMNMLHTWWEEQGYPEWRQTATATSRKHHRMV